MEFVKLFSLKLTSKMPISPGGEGGGRGDQFKCKMIPSSRPKFSDLYTLSQSKLLENHTLHSGTHLYNPYMAVTPPPPFPTPATGLLAKITISGQIVSEI